MPRVASGSPQSAAREGRPKPAYRCGFLVRHAGGITARHADGITSARVIRFAAGNTEIQRPGKRRAARGRVDVCGEPG